MKNQKDKNRKRHGLWEEYYSNGNIDYRGNYNHGLLHGLLESYRYSGGLGYKGAFKKGIQVGLWYESDG